MKDFTDGIKWSILCNLSSCWIYALRLCVCMRACVRCVVLSIESSLQSLGWNFHVDVDHLKLVISKKNSSSHAFWTMPPHLTDFWILLDFFWNEISFLLLLYFIPCGLNLGPLLCFRQTSCTWFFPTQTLCCWCHISIHHSTTGLGFSQITVLVTPVVLMLKYLVLKSLSSSSI